MTSFVTQDLAKCLLVSSSDYGWVTLGSSLKAVSFGSCGCMLCRSNLGGSVHFHCYYFNSNNTCVRSPKAKDVSKIISTLYVIEYYQEFIESRTIDQPCMHVYRPVKRSVRFKQLDLGGRQHL